MEHANGALTYTSSLGFDSHPLSLQKIKGVTNHCSNKTPIASRAMWISWLVSMCQNPFGFVRGTTQKWQVLKAIQVQSLWPYPSLKFLENFKEKLATKIFGGGKKMADAKLPKAVFCWKKPQHKLNKSNKFHQEIRGLLLTQNWFSTVKFWDRFWKSRHGFRNLSSPISQPTSR